MLRKGLAWFVLLALLSLLTPSALSDAGSWSPYRTGTVVGNGTLYAQPSFAAKVSATLRYGENFMVLEERDGWLHVANYASAKPLVGWIYRTEVHTEADPGYVVGIVVSENASLRETPSTAAKRLATVKNGEPFYLLDEQNGWYYVSYWDLKASVPLNGWVRVDFVQRDPWYLTTFQSTYAYCMPDRNAKKIAQLEAGIQLLVLGEMGNFWVVNLRSATAFIAKGDI